MSGCTEPREPYVRLDSKEQVLSEYTGSPSSESTPPGGRDDDSNSYRGPRLKPLLEFVRDGVHGCVKDRLANPSEEDDGSIPATPGFHATVRN